MSPILINKVNSAVRDELFAVSWRYVFISGLLKFLPNYAFIRVRRAMLRMAGITIGPGTTMASQPTLTGRGDLACKLKIGHSCFINLEAIFDLSDEIVLGDNIYLGHRVMILTSNHETIYPERRAGDIQPAPVFVENGAWIGAGAIILPGITVGESSVVAAGAVVTKDVEPHTVVGGIPARYIKSLPF